MSVELPKDAEGREIPLDTECLYSHGGEKQDVLSFTYYRKKDRWEIETATRFINSTSLYLTSLDSWEKLEEDLSRAAKYDAVVASCRYFTADRCADCRMHNGFTCGTRKTERAFADVLERIRKLRGEC